MTRALHAERVDVRTSEGADFHGVDLELGLGEAMAITSIGPADLRALLEVLAGLRAPAAGRVIWERLPALSDLDDETLGLARRYQALRWLRQTHAYVSDSVALLANLTVFENVALPLRYHFNPPERTVRERTERMLAQLGLEAAADERPAWLQLGARRRACVGRALILEPSVLCLDSPLSDIDDDSAGIITSVLLEYLHKVGLSILVTSFEPRPLLSIVSRVLVFRGGRQVAELEGAELDERTFLDRLAELRLAPEPGTTAVEGKD